MKNIKLFPLYFSMCLIMISCSDDDGGGSEGFSSAELVGTWKLVEVNLSAAVDIDGDETSSANLLDELDCLSGTLVLNADTTYQYEQSSFTITNITNDLYFADCSGTNLATGAWGSDGSKVVFQGSSILSGNFSLMGNRIVLSENEELPGVESYIYEKQ